MRGLFLKGRPTATERFIRNFTAAGVVCGAVAAIAAGFAGFAPLGVIAIAAASGAAAGATSAVSVTLISRMSQDNEGDMIKSGLAFIGHLGLAATLSAVAGLQAAKHVEKREKNGLVEAFKGACKDIRQENGAYVLPKGCTLNVPKR